MKCLVIFNSNKNENSFYITFNQAKFNPKMSGARNAELRLKICEILIINNLMNIKILWMMMSIA